MGEDQLQWIEDRVEWPKVPEEIAGTDASKSWIEGRDAAVSAVMRALNETPLDATQQQLDQLLEAVKTHRAFNVATSEDFRDRDPDAVPLDAFSPVDRPLYAKAEEIEGKGEAR